MIAMRIKLKRKLATCLSFLLLATAFCRPAFCGEIHDAARIEGLGGAQSAVLQATLLHQQTEELQ
jgi:hypothetical protein